MHQLALAFIWGIGHMPKIFLLGYGSFSKKQFQKFLTELSKIIFPENENRARFQKDGSQKLW